MSTGTEVPDGATQRHSRIMELLTFINVNEPHGASLTQLQAHMLATYGLKFRTTGEMIQEMAKSGIIKPDGHGYWHLTEKQRLAMEKFVIQEQLDPLIKRIANMRTTDKNREQAMKLYSKLQRIILGTVDQERET